MIVSAHSAKALSAMCGRAREAAARLGTPQRTCLRKGLLAFLGQKDKLRCARTFGGSERPPITEFVW